MASYETNRSFFDGQLVTVSETIADNQRWRNVKELPADFIVPNFNASQGIGRYQSTSTENNSFVGPIVNRNIVCVSYKKHIPTPEEFEVLVLNPKLFVWKKTDQTKALLPPDAFFTGVNTNFSAAYVGKHENHGIGMVLELETSEKPFWTYISTDGKKLLSFEVLCYQ